MTQRVREIDAIRGFALAGILVANIGFLADPGHALTAATPTPEGPVAWFVAAFVLTKFYVVFSFLFGYSFTLQTRSGGNVRARTLRRCLALFVIGLAHGLLLWIGDILTLYAVLGLALLALRGIRPRTAVIAGTAIIVLLTAAWAALAWLSTLDPAAGQTAPTDPAEAARVLGLATGGPLDFLTMQTELYPPLVAAIWLFQGPTALAMFLFGLAAGRSRLLEEPARLSRLLPRVQWAGFGVGVPGALLYAWSAVQGGTAELVGYAVNTVTSILLAAAYVATLLRMIARFPAAGAVLAAPGRVAASNYVGQSLLIALVFTGYGLALAGRLSPLAVMGVAVAIYAFLAWASARWLRTHRYGPVEYVLRRVTTWT
ncbi:MAG: DUF418 domain-containing protein [Nonomuraea sp.]|nr:DUF418 domain-containing protein [Nonomuraea sp.]